MICTTALGDTLRNNSVATVEVLGILTLLLFAVSTIAYMLEYSQRQAFLDQYILRVESEDLKIEKDQTDVLLLSMRPAQAVKRGKMLIAESYIQVTVLFSGIFRFNRLVLKLTANEVVQISNTVYSAFDDLLDYIPVYKEDKVAVVNAGHSEILSKIHEAGK